MLDDLHNPEMAKRVYAFIKGLYGPEWGIHLAFQGGALDQPYWFWHDMMILDQAERIAKELLGNAARKWS